MESDDNVLKTLEDGRLIFKPYVVDYIQQEWAKKGFELARTKRKTKKKDKDEPLFWIYGRKQDELA